MSSGLNDRQKRFCEFFASNGGNGTQAAIDAGYSPQAARQQAARLLTNANILSYVRDLQDQAAAVRVKTVIQTKAFLSDVIDDDAAAMGIRVNAAKILLQSSGALFKENAAEVHLHTSDDVVIYLPAIESDETELYTGNDSGEMEIDQ